jgi:hypothetical protein
MNLRVLWYRHTKVAWDINTEPIFVIGTEKMVTRYSFRKPLTEIFPDWSEWEGRFQPATLTGMSVTTTPFPDSNNKAT